jgi:hypothetical protein
VTDSRLDRHSAALTDDLGHSLGADEVVQDRRPWALLEHRGCDQRCRRGTRQRLAPVVDEEAAVGIAVERESDVGPCLEDPIP